MGELSADGPDDMEGLETTAAHVANLLSTEPANGRFFPKIAWISQSYHIGSVCLILTSVYMCTYMHIYTYCEIFK